METTGVAETMSRNMSYREIIKEYPEHFFGIHQQRLPVYYPVIKSKGNMSF